MKRRFANIIFCASMLAVVAILTAWAYSYHRSPKLDWGNPTVATLWSIVIEKGDIYLSKLWGAKTAVPPGNQYFWLEVVEHHSFAGLGYEYRRGRVSGNDPTFYGQEMLWSLPLWWVLIPSICLGVWLYRNRPRSKFDPGHCRVCGYDLRATPERCPECGSVADL